MQPPAVCFPTGHMPAPTCQLSTGCSIQAQPAAISFRAARERHEKLNPGVPQTAPSVCACALWTSWLANPRLCQCLNRQRQPNAVHASSDWSDLAFGSCQKTAGANVSEISARASRKEAAGTDRHRGLACCITMCNTFACTLSNPRSCKSSGPLLNS